MNLTEVARTSDLPVSPTIVSFRDDFLCTRKALSRSYVFYVLVAALPRCALERFEARLCFYQAESGLTQVEKAERTDCEGVAVERCRHLKPLEQKVRRVSPSHLRLSL